MPFENPYREKVDDHERIFLATDEILSHRGGWCDFFGSDKPIHLEIGTGMGNFFSRYAHSRPDIHLVGMEIKYKRLWRTMHKCEQIGRSDVVLIKEYGEKIAEIFDDGELDEVFLFFPDPWPKKRHWKHRILQESFLVDLHKVLRTGGVFHFKTDDEVYFDWGLDMFERSDLFLIQSTDRDYEGEKKFTQDNSTEFEMMWRRDGKRVMYLQAKNTK